MPMLNCELTELKFADAGADGDALTFSGYGAVFGNVDAYGDVIQPGAFAQYLANVKSGTAKWPAMLLQHGASGLTAEDMTPIGVWTDLAEDGKGLKVVGTLADTARGREIHTLMKMKPRAAIDSLSIQYIPKDWEMRSKPEDPRRLLKRVDLIEISPVTFPANALALVGNVKSDLSIRDAERALRDAGYSRNEAKAIVAHGYQALSQRDADDDLGELAQLILKNTSIFF